MIKKIFYSSDTNLFPVWKILRLFIGVFILSRSLYWLADLLSINHDWQTPFTISIVIIFTLLIITKFEKNKLSSIKLILNPGSVLFFIVAVIFTLLSKYLAVLFIDQLVINQSFPDWESQQNWGVIYSLLFMLLISVNEELIFRGYILTNISNQKIAILTSLLLFVISHFNHNLVEYSYLILFGVFYCYLFYRYNLLVAIGSHFSINWNIITLNNVGENEISIYVIFSVITILITGLLLAFYEKLVFNRNTKNIEVVV